MHGNPSQSTRQIAQHVGLVQSEQILAWVARQCAAVVAKDGSKATMIDVFRQKLLKAAGRIFGQWGLTNVAGHVGHVLAIRKMNVDRVTIDRDISNLRPEGDAIERHVRLDLPPVLLRLKESGRTGLSVALQNVAA